MNRIIPGLSLILVCSTVFGQDPKEVIAKIFKAQSTLTTVSYTLDRRDTLLTGEVRMMSGEVKMEADKRDSILGFKFWGKKDGETEERVYDGRIAYVINPLTKTYTMTTSRGGILSTLYSGGGGHLVFPDLVKLDTTKANSFSVTEEAGFYHLTLTYPDYEPENVVRRFKTFTIDKKTMLPVAMRNHSESYGNVQDLFFKIRTIKSSSNYDFSNPAFLRDYAHEVNRQSAAKVPIMDLRNKKAPAFSLTSFAGGKVSSGEFGGKVVLIDLWEIWCGPCIASMPKVEALFNQYKGQGLLVYGITSDPRALSAAKAMVQKRSVEIPMLIGEEQFKKDYFIQSTPLPMYILIDKNGVIKTLLPGFTDQIEAEIKEALLQ